MRYIFGHNPTTGQIGSKDEAISYLSTELAEEEGFRYRSRYDKKNIQSIIFSFDGELLGELVVGSVLAPTDEDEARFPGTRTVYIIDEIRLFRDGTFRVSDFGLVHSQFGTKVPDDVYAQILSKVGGIIGPVIRNL